MWQEIANVWHVATNSNCIYGMWQQTATLQRVATNSNCMYGMWQQTASTLQHVATNSMRNCMACGKKIKATVRYVATNSDFTACGNK